MRRVVASEAESALFRAPARAPHEPAWLGRAREAARRDLEAHGLPDRKVEDFHYTDLHALVRESFPPLAPPRADSKPKLEATVLAQKAKCPELTFVNGRIHPDHLRVHVPSGAEIESLARAIAKDAPLARQAFGATPARGTAEINAALAEDGFILRVKAGHAAGLISVYNITAPSKPASAHMRNLVVLEEGASAELVEIYETDFAANLTTSVTHVELAAGAKLVHTKLIRGEPHDIHLGRTEVQLGAGADYRAFVHGAGAGLAREELAARLVGQGAHIGFGAALLLSGDRHFDVTARIDHTAPNCTSEMHARAVAGGHAKGVVQGTVHVAKGAQQTDAEQQMRGLLLSPRAELDMKPELVILADDVKCSHGAASGDLDADAIFYLRSRGISETEARALLIEAFLEESYARLPQGPVADRLRDQAAGWLKRLAAEEKRGGGDA